MPNKPKTKEDKITFIMSYRHDEIKTMTHSLNIYLKNILKWITTN